MILFEVFKKRRLFEPILNKTWQAVMTDMPYPQIAEQEAEQKLLYFGLVAYAAVYGAAIAAGMSTSAAHYLARMQIGKYKLGKTITQTVENVFSGHDTDLERAYADFYLTRLSRITDMVTAGEGEVEPVLLELAQGFKRTELVGNETR